MKIFRFILLSGIAGMLFIISGCNDTPNSVGKGSQPPGDDGIMHVDTFYSTDYSSTPNHLSTSSLDRFMLGKYQTYQAWSCLKFYYWPDSLLGVKITSATIRLKGLYHFGDSTASLSFDVYRAKASLANDSLSYDSLSLNGNYYYDNNPLPIQSFIPVGDTESVIITLLDTTMLREWFSTNTDTMHLNDGLVIRPTNSNIIKGFYSFNSSDTAKLPTLSVTYIDTNGNTLSYSHKFGNSKYVSTVDRASLMTDNNLIYVQNGISYRGLVSFDSISTPWPVSVYRAVLQVTSPSSASRAHDSLFVLSVGPTGVSDGAAYALSQRLTDSSGHPMYSFDIRSIATRWFSHASVRKAALSGYFEGGSFDLFKLYGTGTLKPRVIITYAVQR